MRQRCHITPDKKGRTLASSGQCVPWTEAPEGKPLHRCYGFFETRHS
jgi:hypothetical protein